MSFEMNRPQTYEGSSSYVGWMRSTLVYEYSLASPTSRLRMRDSRPRLLRSIGAPLDSEVSSSANLMIVLSVHLNSQKRFSADSKQAGGAATSVGSIAGAQFSAGEASADLAALLHLVTYCQCCHVLCSLDLGSDGGLFADSPLTSVPAW